MANLENIADLVLSQIVDYEKKGYVDLFQTLQNYQSEHVMKRIKKESCASHTFKWNARVATNNAAEMVGIAATGNPTIADLQAQATAYMRRGRTNWSYDDEEMSGNDGGALRIQDMIKMRQMDAMFSLAELMEQQWWNRPSSTSDTTSMWGLKYWIVQNATEGFNGTVPGGGFTDVAGLSPTTYSTWRNYTFPYAAIDINDFINKLDTATYKCEFDPPVEMKPLDGTGSGLTHAYYTTFDVCRQIVRLMETRQDNIGPESAPDLGRYWGKAVYRRVPIVACAYLDANATNGPFYGLAFDSWRYKYLEGWKAKTYRPAKDSHQPTMNTVWVYTQGNYVCLNRRRNFVAHNSGVGVST